MLLLDLKVTMHDIVGYQVSDLISYDTRSVDRASDWLIPNLGTVTVNSVAEICKSFIQKYFKQRAFLTGTDHLLLFFVNETKAFCQLLNFLP